MKMIYCQVSREKVVPKSDGTCPACGEPVCNPRHCQESGKSIPKGPGLDTFVDTEVQSPDRFSSIERPLSVTLISILLLLLGIFILFSGAMVLVPWWREQVVARGYNPWISMPISIINGTTFIISAFAMLKGFRWGRLLYLCYWPFTVFLFWIIYGFRLGIVVSLSLYAVTVIFLLQPKAMGYFSRKKNQ
jgi:hypothetical protein